MQKKSACVSRCFIGKNFIAHSMMINACCGFNWVRMACLACSLWTVLTQWAFQAEMLAFDTSMSCFISSWMSEGIRWHTDSNAFMRAVSSLQVAEHSSQCWSYLWLQALLNSSHFGSLRLNIEQWSAHSDLLSMWLFISNLRCWFTWASKDSKHAETSCDNPNTCNFESIFATHSLP